LTRAGRGRSRTHAALERRTIGANAGFALVSQVGNAVFAAFLTLFLVRALSVHAYGVLGLATAITGVVLLPADFGLIQSTSRFVAEHDSDPREIAAVVATSLRLKLYTTGSVCLVLFASAGVVASLWGKSDLAWPLRAMAVTSLFQSGFTLLIGVLTATGRNDLGLRAALGESIFETAGVVALVLAGGGAAGAGFGRTIGFGLGTAIALVTVTRLVGRGAVDVRAPMHDLWKRMLTYGAAVVVVDSTYQLFAQIDVVLIGAIISTTAVSLYSAPFRFLSLLVLPAAAVSSAIPPRLVGNSRDAPIDTRWWFSEGTRLIAVFQGLLVAPLLVWPAEIVDVALGGSGYHGSIPVLRAFTPYVFLSGLGLFFSICANYLGQVRRRIYVAIATVAVNIVLDIILLPRVGVVGGAIGTSVAYSLYAPGHAAICRRVLGIETRTLVTPILRVVPPAAVMCIVLYAFGTHPGYGATVLGAIIAIVCYLLTAVVTGALRSDDAHRVRQMVRRIAR
jgi:O-antigen/teichoic acid export membrane protein